MYVNKLNLVVLILLFIVLRSFLRCLLLIVMNQSHLTISSAFLWCGGTLAARFVSFFLLTRAVFDVVARLVAVVTPYNTSVDESGFCNIGSFLNNFRFRIFESV